MLESSGGGGEVGMYLKRDATGIFFQGCWSKRRHSGEPEISGTKGLKDLQLRTVFLNFMASRIAMCNKDDRIQ